MTIASPIQFCDNHSMICLLHRDSDVRRGEFGQNANARTLGLSAPLQALDEWSLYP